ncbi:MAG: Ribosomal large subunit pseudouridine synthase B [Candidatus Accumulibacter sp. BA-94]|nr:MAG: Ribosomal large subunit pseudouridine synthase B [Candidatus Accumulibacter sp. BA-94]
MLLYHKPEGEIVSRNDPQHRPSVFTSLPRMAAGRWVAVGRLDFNTSGLLLLTTSGDLANRLMHPRYQLLREYAVRILGDLPDEARQRLLEGIELEDGLARFGSFQEAGGEGANRWYRVSLFEGRNREVRRMFEAVGVVVSRLIRVRYGPFVLPPGLKRGRVEELAEPVVRQLLVDFGMEPAGPRRPPPRAPSAAAVADGLIDSRHSPAAAGRFTRARFFVIIQRFSARPFWGHLTGDGLFAHFLFAAMDVHDILEKTVTGLGYELVDIERSPRGRVLRVFIDKPERPRGVDVEDCALVSNQLSRVLAVEEVDYDRLEVSSPGLDRLLKKVSDFERFAGSEITLKLRLPSSGRRNFSGTLCGVSDGKVRLRTDAGDMEVELGNIDRARLVPRFETMKSGGKPV